VHRQRHLHRDRGRPEAIVVGQWVRPAVGKHAEVDTLESQPRAVLELGERVGEIRPRNDAEPDETVARDDTVFVGQPVVVGPHSRAVQIVVGDPAPQPRSHLHVRKEDLGEQPVHLLLAQALLGRTDTRRALHGGAERLPRFIGAPRSQIEERRGIRRLALDQDRVAAVGQRHGARGALAILRGHARRPALRPDLQMSIARQQRRQRGDGHGSLSGPPGAP